MSKHNPQNRDRLAREAQIKLQQKKRERKITLILIGALALILVAVTVVSVILLLPEKENPNTVCINVSYTDENGQKKTGNIIVELYPEAAPITVANFKRLVADGYYTGSTFHRIIESFMIQGGIGKGETPAIKGEFLANGVDTGLKHERGTISMARTNDYNSATSQFFIVHQTSDNNTKSLDGKYAAFGKVISGMDVVDAIAIQDTNSNDAPVKPVTINSITFVEND